MTLTVFCILLFAALLHASWNAIVKASGDKMYAAIGVSGSAALIALVMLPFAPQPALVSAPYLLASCALQVVYTVLVAKTYQVSDMSQTYPLMRGTAPLLVAAMMPQTGQGSLGLLMMLMGLLILLCWLPLASRFTHHQQPV